MTGSSLEHVLLLLHTAEERWQTIRASGIEWRHERRSAEAFLLGTPQGSVVGQRGAVEHDPAGDAEWTSEWRCWLQSRHKWHAEFAMAHSRTQQVVVENGIKRSRLSESDVWVESSADSSLHDLGPVQFLIDTSSISADFRLQVVGDIEFAGRRAIGLSGHPFRAPSPLRRGIAGLARGSDELRFVVDRERGVLLRAEARRVSQPFRVIEMHQVSFDDVVEDVFNST